MPTKITEDFTLKVTWSLMNVDKPPSCSGLYAIKDANKNTWLYIGKSKSISKRIVCINHPVQVTKNTTLQLKYLFLRASEDNIHWLERVLLKKHNPEWNGKTSIDPSPMGYTPWVFCNLPGQDPRVSHQDLLNCVSFFP